MLDTIEKVMTSDVGQVKLPFGESCKSNGNALKTPRDTTVECIFRECQMQVYLYDLSKQHL